MGKILIIDDEPLTTEMLSTFLRIIGHESVEAFTCAEARAKLLYTTPDAILLDIMLPDMNGIEMCRELRATPETRQMPIIMVSAYAPPLIDQALAAGATGYLSKPISLNVLRSELLNVGIVPART